MRTVHPHARGEHDLAATADGNVLGPSPRPWGTLGPDREGGAPYRSIPTPVGNTVPLRRPSRHRTVHPHARGEHARAYKMMREHAGPSPRPWGTRSDEPLLRARSRSIPTPVGNTRWFCPSAESSPVHPHARGEHQSSSSHSCRQTGPSPRPWGTRTTRLTVDTQGRSIPTPVGNTSPFAAGSTATSVHPHARGEHHSIVSTSWSLGGPSPRPWGTRWTITPDGSDTRSIPTPVGNTRFPGLASSRRSVHPHARGEHLPGLRLWTGSVGPSPRPWGTQGDSITEAVRERSIPTPVGNTTDPSGAVTSVAVHPHARGEHVTSSSEAPGGHGPSPRPWGTPGTVRVRAHGERSIPTPVGNTPMSRSPRRPAPVHPHARGEHTAHIASGVGMSGPSPRPWGTPPPIGPWEAAPRSIPTPVGNTATGASPLPEDAVHPHARGEHAMAEIADGRGNGPSPRPWGTHGYPHYQGRPHRSIPTPVGNTRVDGSRDTTGAVHPHARGEHASPTRVAKIRIGPSPRPWGTQITSWPDSSTNRSIPTPVGNTPQSPPISVGLTVHPHARGEHDCTAHDPPPECTAHDPPPEGGPSPRPWGTPRSSEPAGARHRSIPTPVGNTQ